LLFYVEHGRCLEKEVISEKASHGEPAWDFFIDRVRPTWKHARLAAERHLADVRNKVGLVRVKRQKAYLTSGIHKERDLLLLVTPHGVEPPESERIPSDTKLYATDVALNTFVLRWIRPA
jgi:hypothetical protein